MMHIFTFSDVPNDLEGTLACHPSAALTERESDLVGYLYVSTGFRSYRQILWVLRRTRS